MTKHRGLLIASIAAAVCLAGCSAPVGQDPRLQGTSPEVGEAKIQQYGCGTCHTIPGIPGARANVGPPLDHFARRSYIAGKLANTPPNLAAWVAHPHSIRPDTAMPDMGVSDSDAKNIAAYLYTLR